jgi:hypothetical protein
MPNSKILIGAFARTSSSCSRPTASNSGLAKCMLTTGAVLCAAIHIEQEIASVWVGWLWVDSATAVQNIMDRQTHVNHRRVKRMRSCIWLDSFYPITAALHKAMVGKLLWRGLLCFAK